MNNLEDVIKSEVRDVLDFPKEGIVFKDISTLMMNPKISNEILDHLFELYKDANITKIAGIESRGFLFGYALAMRLNVPFVLIRKEGKLPYQKVKKEYTLEYGKAVIEMHQDAIQEGDSVLIHDDLLATGGSAEAAADLVTSQGGTVHGFNFIIELSFLNGKIKLTPYSKNIINLASY